MSLHLDTRLNPAQGEAASDEMRLRARAAEAAEKFEAFFIKQMMGQMRSATRALADDDSPLKNKINDDMTDLADGLVADAMAGQRAFGIADMMLRQLLPAAGLSPLPKASPLSMQETKTEGAKP